MKQQTTAIIILILLGLGFLAWKSGLLFQPMQVFDIYTDVKCSRNGEIVTCTASSSNYGACGSDYSKRYFGFCYKDALGDNFAEWLQGRLGETYALNSEQRQAVFDNLKLSGSCRFGYDKGTLWGNANDPQYPSDACVYTYLFVDTLSDGSYSQINACQGKQLGRCSSVPVDINKCNGEYPQGWKSSQIQIFFTPYSESGTFGSCTLTTRMVQAPVVTCPSILDFDISKSYEVRSIAIWQKDDCGNWHSYIPNELGNTLNVNKNDYCKIFPTLTSCTPPIITPPQNIFEKYWMLFLAGGLGVFLILLFQLRKK